MAILAQAPTPAPSAPDSCRVSDLSDPGAADDRGQAAGRGLDRPFQRQRPDGLDQHRQGEMGSRETARSTASRSRASTAICRPTRATRTFSCRCASSAKATATAACSSTRTSSRAPPTSRKGRSSRSTARSKHHTGGVYEQTRKWIVWPSPENESVVRPGEWNDYLINVEGNHYISRLNGVVMVDYTDPQPESRRRLRSRCNCTRAGRATCDSRTSSFAI